MNAAILVKVVIGTGQGDVRMVPILIARVFQEKLNHVMIPLFVTTGQSVLKLVALEYSFVL